MDLTLPEHSGWFLAKLEDKDGKKVPLGLFTVARGVLPEGMLYESLRRNLFFLLLLEMYGSINSSDDSIHVSSLNMNDFNSEAIIPYFNKKSIDYPLLIKNHYSSKSGN